MPEGNDSPVPRQAQGSFYPRAPGPCNVGILWVKTTQEPLQFTLESFLRLVDTVELRTAQSFRQAVNSGMEEGRGQSVDCGKPHEKAPVFFLRYRLRRTACRVSYLYTHPLRRFHRHLVITGIRFLYVYAPPPSQPSVFVYSYPENVQANHRHRAGRLAEARLVGRLR